jgi:hypothetical protein
MRGLDDKGRRYSGACISGIKPVLLRPLLAEGPLFFVLLKSISEGVSVLKKEMVYRFHPMNGGVVFAPLYRAQELDRIHRALRDSRTWKELRDSLPWDQYKSIRRYFDDMGMRRPPLECGFSYEDIPGFCEGLYPDWLQAEMEYYLFGKLLEPFGKSVSTGEGSYLHINRDKLPECVRCLEDNGYTVREGSDLIFY